MNPYAALLVLPESHPEHKFVENRPRPFSYRGWLLIHAGKSREWMGDTPSATKALWKLDRLDFGAIIGVAQLVRCIDVAFVRHNLELGNRYSTAATKEMRRIVAHKHTHGPYGLVLTDRLRFPQPVPYRGYQGMFDVPLDVVGEALKSVGIMNGELKR